MYIYLYKSIYKSDRRTGGQACWRESGGPSPAVVLCLGEPSSSSNLILARFPAPPPLNSGRRHR